MENRTERIVVETDRYRIVGDVTLPSEGYRSRISDFLNRGDLDFISLTKVEISPLGDGEVQTRPFMVVSRHQIHLVFPLEEE